ncbi:MAG: hypothetical protein RIK87_13560 [Fuerstiella sp.]
MANVAANDHADEPVSATEFVDRALSCWSNIHSAGGNQSPHATVLPAFPEVADGRHATVSLTLPELPVDAFVDWLGPRLIWWPQGMPKHRRTAIISSRLGRRKDQKRWWFDALRTAVLHSDFDSEMLCSAPDTAAAAAVARAGELFGMPRLKLEIAPEAAISVADLRQWLQQRFDQPLPEKKAAACLEYVAEISPPVQVAASIDAAPASVAPEAAIRDAVTVVAAQRIVAVSCRPRGRIEALLRRQLNDERLTAPVLLASITGGEPVSEELIAQGAVPWILKERCPEPVSDANPINRPPDSTPNTTPQADVLPQQWVTRSGPLAEPDMWLCHWTRPQFGPWRHQPEEDFLDELILGCPTADRSALAALLRILEQKTILASRSARNAAATVSLTAVPLAEFRRRRVFRQHKQRYDFEPWGIAIRRSVVETLGGRAVTYVDLDSGGNKIDKATADTDSDTPSPAAFLQRRTNAQGTIDWSEEREWRLIGDLNLASLGSHDVVVFVNSEEEEFAVQGNCVWPVIAVPQP